MNEDIVNSEFFKYIQKVATEYNKHIKKIESDFNPSISQINLLKKEIKSLNRFNLPNITIQKPIKYDILYASRAST